MHYTNTCSIVILLIALCAARAAAPGDVDPSFNPGSGVNGDVYAVVPQPDGKVVIGGDFTTVGGVARNRIARLNADGSLDNTFDPGTGANSYVEAVAVLPDGKIFIAGSLTDFNGIGVHRIARLNADGSLDGGFHSSTGPNNSLSCLAVQPDNTVLIGGGFSVIDGTSRDYIARLNSDGSLDSNFDPGTGPDAAIGCMALQPDGRVVIGGFFNTINGVNRHQIARLNGDGTLDTSFVPVTGVDQPFEHVYSVAVQPDGKVLLGGNFSSVNGAARVNIARLNADGTLDLGFQPIVNDTIRSIAVQPDNKVLIGGSFSFVESADRSRIARLNPDGSLDTNFNPGTGAQDVILSVALQVDGRVLVGGHFASFNGVMRSRVARLFGGPLPAADTNRWTNPASGKWENSANWSLGLAPSPAQSILITNAGSKTVTIDAGTAAMFPATMTVSNLIIDSPRGTTNTLFLDNIGLARPLRVLHDFRLDHNSLMIIDNSSVQADLNFFVGVFGSSNYLVITNGGRLVGRENAIGASGSAYNRVLITGTNSLWLEVNHDLAIGNDKAGLAMTVAKGGEFRGDYVYLGLGCSANDNTLVVTDPGSRLASTVHFGIGGCSTASLFVISNGASAYSSEVLLGDPSGGFHQAVITGTNSLWHVENSLTVGLGGLSNSLTIADGGALFVTNASQTATFTLNHSGLILGEGTFKADHFIITNNGSVISLGNHLLGTVPGTANSLTVNGSSAFEVLDGVLGVGNDGTLTGGSGSGSLVVENGSLTADSIILGSSTGGSGDMMVGDGGDVTVLGGLTVNDAEVKQGGRLRVLYNDIPFNFEDPVLQNRIVAGYLRDGALKVTGGTVMAPEIVVGVTNGSGMLRISSGSVTTTSNVLVGMSSTATGMVMITGGTLSVTNGVLGVGNAGNLASGNGTGCVIVSNGTVVAASVQLGSANGGAGEMEVQTNGIVTVKGGFGANKLKVRGGTVEVQDGPQPPFEDPIMHNRIVGGYLHDGAVEISSGTVRTPEMLLGVTPAKTGTLTMSGGSIIVQSNLLVGDCAAGANGVVTLSEGTLTVTNAAHTATLVMRKGSFTMTGGTLVVDRLILTNGCSGTFTRTGGRIIYRELIADPNGDLDGDGQSNAAEALAGTDPFNADSVFRVVSATVTNQNVRVDWTTVGGHSYVVQTATNATGSVTTNFMDVSPVISVGGTAAGTTNYSHPGGATNHAGYYRVRLGP